LSTTITALTDTEYRPFSRGLAWLAADGDGNPVGSAYLTLYKKPSQAHVADLQLAVHPADRRQGIGSQLLAAVADAARANDARIVLTDAQLDSPGDHFLAHHGFTVGFTLTFTRLPLAAVDNEVLAAAVAADHPGYRLVSWQGVVPDELGETFTAARSAMDDAPAGEIDFGPEVWDLDRTKAAAERIAQRGEHLETIATVETASGRIVGFTELVVPGDGKGDAQHYGTAVLKEHRGHGLARWMKAGSIRQAQHRFPELAGLLTDMVDTNTAMRRINADLGYRTLHQVRRYKLAL
jgi:GNAT superfamily N-acetyltransferase